MPVIDRLLYLIQSNIQLSIDHFNPFTYEGDVENIHRDATVIELTLDALSDHRGWTHRSHEAFLEYGHHTMKAEREALLLKLALCKVNYAQSRQVESGSTIWDIPPKSPNVLNREKPSQFTHRQLSEFATGSLVKCFGEHYSIYDGKRAPRTPNGDLLLMSRILEVTGTRGAYKEKASLVAEYAVPAEAWFYQHNSAPVMPYSIYMEIALQPCGFLATYMGCTLIYPDLELCFRNLDSHATLLREVDLRNQTITATSELTSVASSAETVIVQFDYELSIDGNPFFKGDTTFGYFTPNALANQVGLDRGEKALPWYMKKNLKKSEILSIDLNSPESQTRYFTAPGDKPHFYQPSGQLHFLDKAIMVEKGGDYGLGYIYAEKEVDPRDWFFPCHFYQDPVMPGSLGVEAILQSMRLFALQRNLGQPYNSPYFSNAVSSVIWRYRGQIVQANKQMSIEAHIKTVEQNRDRTVITADASLWKDGLRIYELTDAAIAIVEGAR